MRASLEIAHDERLTANCVAFSPDGKTLLAGYDDGKIRLWNLASKTVVWTDDLDGAPIATVAFSPDGKMFAAGTGDQYRHSPGVVGFWDAQSQTPVTTVTRRSNVFGLAFTPDGKTLAIVGGNYGGKAGKTYGEIALYDVAAQKLNELPWGDGYVLGAVAISHDGQFLVTPKGNSMNCWSLAKGEFATDYHTHAVHGNTVRAIAISPDGKMLVTGVAPGWDKRTDPGELRRWDMSASGWPEIKTPAWVALPGGVLELAFSPDGKWLATGGYDGNVRLWNTSTGEVAATLTGHHQLVTALAFAPDGKTVASGSSDGSVKWWDVPVAGAP